MLDALRWCGRSRISPTQRTAGRYFPVASTRCLDCRGYPYSPWDVVEAAITAGFPNHQVLSGRLVEDTFFGSPAGVGKAYYDLLTIDNVVLEDHSDTNQNNQP